MGKSINQLIEEFEYNEPLALDYSINCKPRKANILFDRNRKIASIINSMDKESRDKFLALIYSDNPHVACSAAHYNLKYATNECVKVLKKLENAGISFVSTQAEYSLKSWYDGTWKEP